MQDDAVWSKDVTRRRRGRTCSIWNGRPVCHHRKNNSIAVIRLRGLPAVLENARRIDHRCATSSNYKFLYCNGASPKSKISSSFWKGLLVLCLLFGVTDCCTASSSAVGIGIEEGERGETGRHRGRSHPPRKLQRHSPNRGLHSRCSILAEQVSPRLPLHTAASKRSPTTKIAAINTTISYYQLQSAAMYCTMYPCCLYCLLSVVCWKNIIWRYDRNPSGVRGCIFVAVIDRSTQNQTRRK